MQYHYHLLECAVNDKVGILATLRDTNSLFFSKIAFGCNDTVAMKVRKIHSCLDPRGPLVLHLMDPFVFFALSSIGQPNVFDRVLKV